MISFFTQTQQGALAALFFVLGVVVGRVANLWSIALTKPAPADSTTTRELALGGSKPVSRPFGLRGGAIEVATGLLFASYVTAYLRYRCQELAEVRPDDFWLYGRILYQLILISLLVAATATDLRDFVIPDQITLLGTLLGLAGATYAGQLQMVHLWVDWNQEIPGIAGPFLPEWLDPHQHWHGFAWSLGGAVCGAGLTWFVRFCSSRILGREALGLGDVTLMAMIGTFLGWQPTVFVFLIAPLCGLAMLLPIRLFWKRGYVPYGPFLAGASIVVLLSWKWLWLSSRLVFGDPRSLAFLAAGALVTFVALLFAFRLFRGGPIAPGPNGD